MTSLLAWLPRRDAIPGMASARKVLMMRTELTTREVHERQGQQACMINVVTQGMRND